MLVRRTLLAASESAWLRRHVSTLPFVRRAVARFMPGERLEEAAAAAVALRAQGLGAVLTRLGENVRDAAMADAAARHYTGLWAPLGARGLDCEISIKLTQLGLDVDEERCYDRVCAIAEEAWRHGAFVWIDMEQYGYVDPTLHLYRRALRDRPNLGVCLQAYLYRTAADLASLRDLGGGVRLVKGAYREPASRAHPKKGDVDEHFFALATQMIAREARAAGLRAVFGTHDRRLIDRILRHADATSVPREAFEFHMLFGIRPSEQVRLVRDACRVRVLISYGEQWFPWYMRRLAERPANLWFVARSMVSGTSARTL